MKNFVIALLTLCATFSLKTALAGECMRQMVSADYIENTDLIFEGHVSEDLSDDTRPSIAEQRIERLTVTKLWKGDLEGDVTITQNYYHAMGFHRGKKYLVFADKYSDDSYSTSRCSANVEIGDEKPHEIKILEGYLGTNKEKEKE